MRAKEYPLLQEALEIAARRATSRTLKHRDSTDLRDPAVQGQVEEQFVDCALTEICERFELDGPTERVAELFESVLANLQEQVGKGQPPQDGQEDDECQPGEWAEGKRY